MRTCKLVCGTPERPSNDPNDQLLSRVPFTYREIIKIPITYLSLLGRAQPYGMGGDPSFSSLLLANKSRARFSSANS